MLAADEFEQATEFIAVSSPAYAAGFAQRVLEAVELVAAWPESGALVPELEDPSLREVFVKHYRVIYRVERDGITVVALVHGARNLAELWDPDQRDPRRLP